jgi:DNA-binding beta-propeller fold protein YncE
MESRGSRIALVLLCLIGASAASSSLAADDNRAYITTARPTVLFSINDGEAGSLVSGVPQVIEDSVTVIRVFPDQPPSVATVYGTAGSTVLGSPYAAIVGEFGIVTNHDLRLTDQSEFFKSTDAWVGNNEVISFDLTTLEVVGELELDISPWLAVAHPDGRRVIVSLSNSTVSDDNGFAVLEVGDDGALRELSRSSITAAPISFDLGRDGQTIIAAVMGSDGGYVARYMLNEDNSITHVTDIAAGDFVVDGPFSPRISPDGTQALVLNSFGASDGKLDDALVVDLVGNRISHRIPQVADGLESLAFHPSGEFAVISCLNLMPWTTMSFLAVVDLSKDGPQLISSLPIEKVPEGIEFSADGRQLFVGSTLADHISVFDFDGSALRRSPYVLLTGSGPAALGIKTQ